MTGKIIPNAFQMHNLYVDQALEMLTPEEWKCLSFAIRHILGWQDKINTRRGFISLTMFEDGYMLKDGTRYGGTGLTRAAILKATGELSRFELLVPVMVTMNGVEKPHVTPKGQEYELGETPNWPLMLERFEDWKETNRKRTEKATAASKAKRASTSDAPVDGGSSDVPEVVRATYQSQYVGRTDGGSSDVLNQSHLQSHSQNQDKLVPDGTVKPSSRKKERNPLFDAVAQHVFGIALDELTGTDGGRIGAITAWLAGTSDGMKRGKKKLTVGFISKPAEPRHVQAFAADYKAEKPGISLPKDFEKFVEAWRAWASSKKLTTNGSNGSYEPVYRMSVEDAREAEAEAMQMLAEAKRRALAAKGIKT